MALTGSRFQIPNAGTAFTLELDLSEPGPSPAIRRPGHAQCRGRDRQMVDALSLRPWPQRLSAAEEVEQYGCQDLVGSGVGLARQGQLLSVRDRAGDLV